MITNLITKRIDDHALMLFDIDLGGNDEIINREAEFKSKPFYNDLSVALNRMLQTLRLGPNSLLRNGSQYHDYKTAAFVCGPIALETIQKAIENLAQDLKPFKWHRLSVSIHETFEFTKVYLTFFRARLITTGDMPSFD